MRRNCASTTNVSPSNKSAFSRLSCSVNEHEMLLKALLFEGETLVVEAQFLRISFSC
jgi:hypothetical protein